MDPWTILQIAAGVLVVLAGLLAWLLARIDGGGRDARASIARVHDRVDVLGHDLAELRGEVGELRGCLSAHGAPSCPLRNIDGASQR